MNIEVVYVYPVCASELYLGYAWRFLNTYHQFDPGAKHRTTLVVNGGPPNVICDCFKSSMPDCRFFLHDNTGWDIGAFQAVARSAASDMLVCFGSYSYFHKPGWLGRFVDAWDEFGPGLYANMSCGPRAMTPVRTTGFACPPALIRSYPKRVVTKQDRYDFEHYTDNNFTTLALRQGLPVKFVTWDKFYDVANWEFRPNNLVI